MAYIIIVYSLFTPATDFFPSFLQAVDRCTLQSSQNCFQRIVITKSAALVGNLNNKTPISQAIPIKYTITNAITTTSVIVVTVCMPTLQSGMPHYTANYRKP